MKNNEEKLQELSQGFRNRINKELDIIIDDLTPNYIFKDDKDFLYNKGSLEKSLREYQERHFIEGEVKTEIDYFKDKLAKLLELEKGIREFVKKLKKEENYIIKYTALFSEILNIRKFLESLILGKITIDDLNAQKQRNLIHFEKHLNSKKHSIITKPALSYKLKDQSKMNVFFKLLQKHKFISKDTSFKTVASFFSGKEIPLDKSLEQIQWNSNSSSLLYFIDELNEEQLLNEKFKRFNYKLLKCCFKLKEGDGFSKNLPQIKKNISTNVGKGMRLKMSDFIKEFNDM